MAKLKKSVSGFGTYRAAHTRALGAAQLLPLTGDGPRAKAAIGYLSGQRIFCPVDMQWRRRARLVEARYLDWLDDHGLRAA